MKFLNKKEEGFTLMEFLIYIGIVVFMMTNLTLAAMNVMFGRVKVTAMESVSRNGSFAMEKINYAIRNAEAINSVGSSSLELAMPSSKNNPTTFGLSNGSITMQEGTQSQVLLTTSKVNVTGLNFTQIPGKAVQVEMTVEFANPQNMKEYEFIRTFRTIENLNKS